VAGDAPVIALMGRGGQARVVLDAALAAGLHVTGLLEDDGPEAYFGLPVIGPVASWSEHPEAAFIVGMSDPHQRAELGTAMLAAGRTVLSVVHPGAYVSPRAVLGNGTHVMHGATVQPDARLGDFVIMNANSCVDHDSVLETGAQIGPGVTFPSGIVVGEFASVGAGVVARPGCRIGAGATVGAGAVLTKDVPAGETWVGNPARPLERRA